MKTKDYKKAAKKLTDFAVVVGDINNGVKYSAGNLNERLKSANNYLSK